MKTSTHDGKKTIVNIYVLRLFVLLVFFLTTYTGSFGLNSGLIIDHPMSQTVCSGNTANFSVLATGSGLNYQWRRNGVNLADGGNISGSGTSSLTITAATGVNAGMYDVIVWDCCTTDTSVIATLVVNTAPSIINQPNDILQCEGTNAIFNITASGSNLIYQWQKDGVNLINGGNVSGATSSTLTISNISSTDVAGYHVVVSNTSCPSTSSNVATLTIGVATEIIDHPESMVFCSGGNATFSVNAIGENLTYQWKKNGVNLSNGGKITGANSAVLTITGATSVDAGWYDVTVTGDCGTEPSAAATLIINNPPQINTQPVSQSACEGNNVSFSVTASGSNLVYQWKKDSVNVVNGGNISGATSATLTINNITQSDVANYHVVVSNTACGSTSSNVASLSIAPQTEITDHPESIVFCSGGNATFSVSAIGSNLSYQWKKNGVNLNNGGNISGATSSVLTITGATSADAGWYDVTVTGDCGTEPSAAATLVINNPPQINTQPVSQLACEGNNVSFTVSATGSNLVYQWRKNGVNLVNGGTISGATSSTVTITGVTGTDAGSYDVVISNTTCPSATSNTATLTVGAGTIISEHPESIVLCSGGNVSFNVIATGSNLTYQWKKNGVNLNDGGNISGATTSVLTITGATSTNAGWYDVSVTGDCGTEPSAAATLVINNPPQINTQPVSQLVCEGSNAVFSVSATGTNLIYRWRKNGVDLNNGGNISGATSSTLTISSITSGDVANYDVVISNTACSPATSTTVTLSLSPATVITDHPESIVFCSGGNATFTVIATGQNLNYQWKKNGVNLSDGGNISGSNSSTLTITGAVSGDAGFYDVAVTGDCGTEFSAAATLVINNPPQITSQPLSQSNCKGGNVVFSVSATGTNLIYQWRKDGVNLSNGGKISGATSSTLTVSNINSPEAGIYDVVISNTSCPTVVSDTASLTINNQPTPVISGAGNACEFTIEVYSVGGSVNDQYAWNVTGGNIIGFSAGNNIEVLWGPGGNGIVSVTQTNSFGCDSTVVLTVTINNNPAVSLAAFNSVCSTDAPFALSGGSPAGGVYSGPGVSAGVFNPATAGVGTHTIKYVYTNANGCSDSATASITVNNCSTVPFTQLQAQYCSYTLNTMQDWVFSDIVAGAVTYQYYVEEVGSANPLTAYYNRTSASSPNGFSLSWINGVKYNTTYSVQVRVKVGNDWGLFGTACYVTTPASIPTPTINPQYCNITLNNIQDLIYVTPQWGAINYHYEITHPATGFVANYYRGSGSWAFSFSWVKGLLYDSTYVMRYRANINGTWSSFSDPCTYTMSSFPATQLASQYCNTTIPSLDYLMSVNPVINATNYYYTITDSAGFTVNYYRNSTSNLINLMWIPNITAGKTYYISVQAMQNSTMGPAGPVCSITVPSQTRFINNLMTENNNAVKVYPNPGNGSGINLILPAANKTVIDVEIFDAGGKTVYKGKSGSLEITFDNKLKPGIYMMRIDLGNKIESIKFVVQ